jgi:beta-glucosidase
MGTFELRPNMLLGVSSSATQVEGGELDHTWADWCKKGNIIDGSSPAVAAGHWERWYEDALLMRFMGIQTCRFSVQWARVEPREGEFDQEAIRRIKEEVMLLLGLGIRPLVTLHHFTNPMWFEEKGGWENPDNIKFFLSYVEKMVRELGHLVSEYITINEPNVYAAEGYYFGNWPPGKKSLKDAGQVLSVMAAAHIRSYRLIHNLRRGLGFSDTRVGFAIQFRASEGKNTINPLYLPSVLRSEKLFQSAITEAMAMGKFTKPLKNYARARQRRYCDFHGLSYYGQIESHSRKGAAKHDQPWEPYPPGIVKCAQMLNDICPLPIYITENGVCSNDDNLRIRFIYEHLNEISRCSLPVERYYYRSFLDGFEWTEGCSARYGLVSVDSDTLERSLKRSGEFYSRIMESRGVTQELFDEYVAAGDNAGT